MSREKYHNVAWCYADEEKERARMNARRSMQANKDFRVLWIAPNTIAEKRSFCQMLEVLREYTCLLANVNYVSHKITLTNDAFIQFVHADKPHTIRGQYADYIVVEDQHLIELITIEDIVEPLIHMSNIQSKYEYVPVRQPFTGIEQITYIPRLKEQSVIATIEKVGYGLNDFPNREPGLWLRLKWESSNSPVDINYACIAFTGDEARKFIIAHKIFNITDLTGRKCRIKDKAGEIEFVGLVEDE